MITQSISILNKFCCLFQCSLQGCFDDLELNELFDDIPTQMSFQ